MIHKFNEAADAFFGELAKSANGELRALFAEMLRELVMKCAVEAGNSPSDGISQWAGGRISICSELANRAEGALAGELGKANPEPQSGLSYPPI